MSNSRFFPIIRIECPGFTQNTDHERGHYLLLPAFSRRTPAITCSLGLIKTGLFHQLLHVAPPATSNLRFPHPLCHIPIQNLHSSSPASSSKYLECPRPSEASSLKSSQDCLHFGRDYRPTNTTSIPHFDGAGPQTFLRHMSLHYEHASTA
jgi:hypothetical protein